MKYVGFISEIDDYSFSKSLKKHYLAKTNINPNLQQVTTYLKSGILCVPFMGIAEDENENRMGNISVKKDGEWFWPDYFANYLEKYPAMQINPEFERHVLKNQGKKPDISDERVTDLEKEFLACAKFK